VCLVTYRGGISARRWSPILLLTGLNVEFVHMTNEAATMPKWPVGQSDIMEALLNKKNCA